MKTHKMLQYLLHMTIIVYSSLSFEKCRFQNRGVCPEEKSTLICKSAPVVPSNEEIKSITNCDGLGYNMLIREENGRYEEAAQVPNCYSNDESVAMAGRKEGGLKLFDINEVVCAMDVCQFKLSTDVGKCLPLGQCMTATGGKEKLTCATGYHLELKDPNMKTWTEITAYGCGGRTVVGKRAVSSTESDLLVRCRKDRPVQNSCDVTSYFSNTECDRKSKCTKPEITPVSVTCASGTLQAVLDDWENVPAMFTVKCGARNHIVMDKFGVEYEPQMLRCRQDAVCEVDLASYNEPCPPRDMCYLTYSADRTAIECATGHRLEGQVVTGEWFFVEKMECFNGNIYPMKEGIADGRDYKKLRCRKPRECKIEQFYNAILCETKLICKQPDPTLKCENEFKLEYFSATNNNNVPVWSQNIDKIICETNQFILQISGKKSDIVPLGLRCSKERGCNLINYEPFTCDPKDECIEPTKSADNTLNCDEQYELQSKQGAVWTRVHSISCPANAFISKVSGTESVIVSARCVRKNIELVFDVTECTDKQECKKATDHKSMTCEDGFTLQVKIAQTWQDVNSIAANSDKFIVKPHFGAQPDGIRCVKLKTEHLFEATDCEEKQECKQATGKQSMTCEADFTLQVKTTSAGWTDVQSIAANSDKFTVTPDVGAQPERIRCVRMKIETFYEVSDCEEKQECQQATGKPSMTCEADFMLQVKITAIWQDVESIVVHSDKLTVMNTDNVDLGVQTTGIRCARIDIEKFFDASNDCTKEELCTKANSADRQSLKCDANFALQVKLTSEWKVVKSIAAIKNKFTVKNEDDTDRGTSADGIRCVRMRCSTCSNPCLNCTLPPSFNPSTKWNECASFGCGPKSIILIGNEKLSEEKMECHAENKEGESSWKKADGTSIKGDVQCEKLCTLQSPLVSSCVEGDTLCEKISFNDSRPITCSGILTRKSKSDNKMTTGSQLTCNRATGEWIMKTVEGEMKVKEGDNVYCKFEDCDQDFCKECVKVPLCSVTKTKCDNGKESQVYACPDGQKTIAGSTVDDTKSPSPSLYFSCKNSKWLDNGGNQVDDSTVIECDSPHDGQISTGGFDSTLLVYILILIVVILLIFISIAYIVCRLKGNGWLHTIILDKVRGKKKGRKDMKTKQSAKSVKGYTRSSKGDSSYKSGTPKKNTEKEASVPEMDQNSADPLRPSGEKVSAEQISQTGAPSAEKVSAEKVSAEQISATGGPSAEGGFSSENMGGGAVIPGGPNEPVDPMSPIPQIPQTYNA